MKTPKVNKFAKKDTLNAPLGGKVRKSLGNPTAKKSGNVTLKNAEHALNSIINEDPSEIKVKGNKGRMSLPAGVLRNISNKKNPKANVMLNNKGSQNDSQSGSKSPKQKGKGKAKAKDISNSDIDSSGTSPVGLNFELKQKKSQKKSPIGKAAKTKSPLQENNTSPVKKNMETRKAKCPFDLDLSVDALTPLKNQSTEPKSVNSNKDKSGNSSPEVELGLKLEEALSPKSKKKMKRKLMKSKLQTDGKLNVLKKDDEKVISASSGENEQSGKKKRKKTRGRRKSKTVVNVETSSLFEEINVKNALNALLKVINTDKSKQKELFTEDQYVMLQVALHKVSPQSKGVLHVALPHLILPDAHDVCLITPDLKGKRNEPDEAIDFYKEFLKKNKIDFISEIIPIRKLKNEYSQYEVRSKLASRFDAILVEAKVNKMARIGRRFARSRKCVSAVKLDSKNLKEEFNKGIRKVAVFSSGNGNCYSVKCGRVGMSIDEMCSNITCIGKTLANDRLIVGNKNNIASVYVRTATSKSFPIYVSTISPNEAPVPKGKEQKSEKSVKDEVSTVLDGDVIVHPSGNVRVKKRKNEDAVSDEEDEAKVTEKSNRTKKAKILSRTDLKSQNKLKGEVSAESSDDDDDEDDEDSSVASLSESMLDNLDDIDSEDIDSDEDEEEIEEEEEDDDDDEEGAESGDASATEDSDDDEADLEAAEEEYLQEIRKLNDGILKKKKGQQPKSNEKVTTPTAGKKKGGKSNGVGKVPEKKPKVENKGPAPVAKGKTHNHQKPAPQGKGKIPNQQKAGNLVNSPKGNLGKSPTNQQQKKNNKNSPMKQNSPKFLQGRPKNDGVKNQPFKKKGKNAMKSKGKGKSP